MSPIEEAPVRLVSSLTGNGKSEEEQERDAGIKPSLSIRFVDCDVPCNTPDIQGGRDLMGRSSAGFDIDGVRSVIQVVFYVEASRLAFITRIGKALVFCRNPDLRRDGVGEGILIPRVKKAFELVPLFVNNPSRHKIYDHREE